MALPKLKTSEREHIKGLGSKWDAALAAAIMSVRREPKLVGLDKIREPMAYCAALKATGCPGHDGFVVPANAGTGTIEMEDIVNAAYTRAVSAAEQSQRVSA